MALKYTYIIQTHIYSLYVLSHLGNLIYDYISYFAFDTFHICLVLIDYSFYRLAYMKYLCCTLYIEFEFTIFKSPAQRLSQIMRDFGLCVICLIRLKIILPSLNLFLGADKSISVMKLRNKWFLAKLHSFIGVCKISYIKHVLSTKQSPLQLSASS